MAKAPRPRRPDEDQVVDSITITVNGTAYPVRFNELSAKDASDLRRHTGLSLRGVLAASQTDPDIDIVAALVWLSRRQNGARNIPFDAVANEITYESDYAYGDLPEEDPDDPQR